MGSITSSLIWKLNANYTRRTRRRWTQRKHLARAVCIGYWRVLVAHLRRHVEFFIMMRWRPQSEFRDESYFAEIVLWGYLNSKGEDGPCDRSLIRLVTIPACNRQTDRRTERYRWTAVIHDICQVIKCAWIRKSSRGRLVVDRCK